MRLEAILNKPTCSVEELMKLFDISKNPAYEGVKSGDVPSVRIRGCIRIPTTWVKAKLGLGPLPDSILADALRELLRGVAG